MIWSFLTISPLMVAGRTILHVHLSLYQSYSTFWNAKELDLEYRNDFVSSIRDRLRISHMRSARTNPTIELCINHSVSHAAWWERLEDGFQGVQRLLLQNNFVWRTTRNRTRGQSRAVEDRISERKNGKWCWVLDGGQLLQDIISSLSKLCLVYTLFRQ